MRSGLSCLGQKAWREADRLFQGVQGCGQIQGIGNPYVFISKRTRIGGL